MSAAFSSRSNIELKSLKQTPLHGIHIASGARMVPFAGYEMPLHYRFGVLKEHLHTRAGVGLFDVSHMGQIAVRTQSGKADEVALALERLVPADIIELAPGRQRYTLLTGADGGILDDIMVANLGTHFIIIANATNKDADLAHLRANMPGNCQIEMLADRALIALQGPGAPDVLAPYVAQVCSMRFMDIQSVTIDDSECVISRSGYTGEDGFEISIPSNYAEPLVNTLLRNEGVALVGLGARDTLRLEAGLCLYGSDIDDTTTPVEAVLEWSIPKSRRVGGTRAGGFFGADVVLAQIVDGPRQRRVGLRPEGRVPIRRGARIYPDETSTTSLGEVTSGGYGPSLMAPIAMGYIECTASEAGTRVFVDIRGVRQAALVAPLPFFPHRYRR